MHQRALPESPGTEQTDNPQSGHPGQAAGTPDTAGTHHIGVALGARMAASHLFWGIDIQVLHHFLNDRVPNLACFVDKSKQ
jgi:hypothetical protein